MKTKLFTVIAVAAIIALALAVIGCKGDDDTTTGGTQEQPKVQREFTDITFLGKSIKLIDETNNPKDLKERGIWKQIQDGIDTQTINPASEWAIKFNEIYATGNFAIVITSGEDYIDGIDVDGYKVLFRENQLSEYTAEDIGGGIYFVVDSLMTEKPQKQPDTLRTLSFGTAEKPSTVTITSDDQFTADEWKTLCDKVVAAVERGYNKYNDIGGFDDFSNKDYFENAVATMGNAFGKYPK